MDQELINKIASLFDKLDEHENYYQSAIEENKDFNTLETIKEQRRELEEELKRFELLLFDNLSEENRNTRFTRHP